MKSKNTRSFQSKIADIKVRINPDLEKYEHQTLFPEKLAKANEMLKNKGIPKELLQQ